VALARYARGPRRAEPEAAEPKRGAPRVLTPASGVRAWWHV